MTQLDYVITDFGAEAGKVCTEAIQRAIDGAGAAGGGRVVVPDGTWTSGTLHLRSGVTLHVMPGAVLLASPDMADFPAYRGLWENTDQLHHFLIADDCRNVTITGGGVLDGNGPAYWDEPAEGSRWYRERNPRVHPMLELRKCRQLVMDNIRIANSGGWTVHLMECDDVILRGVRLDNHMFGPNTDGFDINGSRDVFISDCKLNCGDDAIIIKARTGGRSTERVTISNCITRSNCIGIGIGCETGADVRQVTVSNCVMYQCHRMFAIGMWEGGVVEDVTVTGCVGDTFCPFPLARPIHIDVKQHVKRGGPLGQLRNVQISNFVARTTGRILLTAQEGAWLENVVLRDVRLHYTALEHPEAIGPRDGRSGSNQYSNFNPEARKQPAALIVENARNFVLDGFYVDWPGEQPPVPYAGIWARHIQGGLINAPLVRPLGQERAMVLEDVTVLGV